MTLLDAVVLLAGAVVAAAVFLSAVQTVVVPRGVPVRLTRAVFLVMRRVFEVRVRFARDYESRDRAYALYAPLTLVTLPVVWLVVVLMAFTAIFWAVGVQPLRVAFITSGSSLLTLGFAGVPDLPADVVALTEAVFGLILLALLITYLPSMYGSFSRREAQVTMVSIFAGDPPWAVEMIERFHEIEGLDRLESLVWSPWTTWFVVLQETHTSLSALPFFRSPQPNHSWVTAAGVVLDGAALLSSTVDVPRSPPAELCIPQRIPRPAGDRRILRAPTTPIPRRKVPSASLGMSSTPSTTGWRPRACPCAAGTRRGVTSSDGGRTTTTSSSASPPSCGRLTRRGRRTGRRGSASGHRCAAAGSSGPMRNREVCPPVQVW